MADTITSQAIRRLRYETWSPELGDVMRSLATLLESVEGHWPDTDGEDNQSWIADETAAAVVRFTDYIDRIREGNIYA